MTNRSGLTADSAAVNVDQNVVFVQAVADVKRAFDGLQKNFIGNVFFRLFIVNGNVNIFTIIVRIIIAIP